MSSPETHSSEATTDLADLVVRLHGEFPELSVEAVLASVANARTTCSDAGAGQVGDPEEIAAAARRSLQQIREGRDALGVLA